MAPQTLHIDTLLPVTLSWRHYFFGNGRDLFTTYSSNDLFFFYWECQWGWLRWLKGIWFLPPFEVRGCFYCCFIHLISCVWKASMFGLPVILHPKIPSLEVMLSRSIFPVLLTGLGRKAYVEEVQNSVLSKWNKSGKVLVKLSKALCADSWGDLE